jgi:hypothetical protein
MSSNQRETAISFLTSQRGLVKQKLTKTKWVLMRLDATTLTDKNKSAILNIQRETKLVTR